MTMLRIATRKSPLALWQAEYVARLLKQHWPDLQIELLPMSTSGDRFLKDKLLEAGGKGLFVKELEEALLDGRADLAVHSMKDVPAQLPDRLTLGAMLARHNPLDALISAEKFSLSSLPDGACIGTSSLRRQAQLLAFRPDLRIKTLRGNINTRLHQLAEGQYQAIILAAAGLERMQLEHQISEIISPSIMLPACGQGALGIEYRLDDQKIHDLVAPLNDVLTATCVGAERTVNALLGGNCHVPLAVFCQAGQDDQLHLQAKVLNAQGSEIVTDSQSGPRHDAQTLAQQCSANLLAKGAAELLA